MTSPRDAEFADYVAARIPSFRRLAVALCQDWHRADDLVQAAITKLYVNWPRARAADNTDSYARAIIVREFITERRSGWVRRVSLRSDPPDAEATRPDADSVLDLRAALAVLPPRQRATLVLRFYCDLNVDQSAQVLGCSPGTVKSQTAKALDSLRRIMAPGAHPAGADGGPPAASPPAPVTRGRFHA